MRRDEMPRETAGTSRITPLRELRDDAPRPLPANVEAEQALLGAILVNNSAYHRVAHLLAPEHFSYPVHGRTFAAMAVLIAAGKPANPITLKPLFDQDPDLRELGGARYLGRLVEGAVTVVNAPHYAEDIVKAAQLRLLIETCRATIDRAAAGDTQVSAEDIIAEHSQQLSVISAWSLDRLEPFDPVELDGVPVPVRPWLVHGWIPLCRATGLYGAGGEGKTLVAQQLATSCAIGAKWIGLEVLQCRSLLFYCEDDRDEMQRRQDDINRAYGCGFRDLGAMRWEPRLGNDNALMDFPDGVPRLTAVFRQLLGAAREHQAKLIIVDTLADVFLGNENDRAQARAFAQQALGHLARETGGAVIALAHPSRSGMNSGSGESGSTAWIGTFRSQLYLSTPKPGGKDDEPLDPDGRVLARRKSNAARRADEISLRWEDGVFVSLSAAASGDLFYGGLLLTCERLLREVLEQAERTSRRLSDSNHASNNYAPRVCLKHRDRGTYTLRDFEKAMEALFAVGEIEMRGNGRERRMVLVDPPPLQGSHGVS